MNIILTEDEVGKRAYNLTVKNLVDMCLDEILTLNQAYDQRPNILGLAEAKIGIEEGLRVLKAWQSLDKKKNYSEIFATGVQGKIDMCKTALKVLGQASILMPAHDKDSLLSAANSQIEALKGKTSRSDLFKLRVYLEATNLLKQNRI